ncbi:MAG: HAD family hydrolase [Alphaproteobacteria bacterium]|nr:HAD family hydrolase [Alphaproteobacteria bacterium]MBV8549350.1 HAD family hydrolase [Alphaproteobacteria bacterium]
MQTPDPHNTRPLADLHNVDLILWDLDGTKYTYHRDIEEHVYKALIPVVKQRLAENGLPPLTDAQIRDIGGRSFRTHSVSWMGFAEEYGFDWRTLFEDYQNAISIDVVLGEPCDRYLALLEKTRALGIRHAIFTHSNAPWVWRVLEKLGLKEFFADCPIFDLHFTDGAMKQHGRTGYEIVLSSLGVAAERVLMVDDFPQNLSGAKELGMLTALMDREHGYAGTPAPQADYRFALPQDLLTALLETR